MLCISKLRLWLTTQASLHKIAINEMSVLPYDFPSFRFVTKENKAFDGIFTKHQINHPQDDRLNLSTLTILLPMQMQSVVCCFELRIY